MRGKSRKLRLLSTKYSSYPHSSSIQYNTTMRDAVPPGINGDREILPTNLKPTHYFLLFEPDFENAVEFDGSVVIDIDVLEETSSISLHASNDMTILKTTVASDMKKTGVAGTTYDVAKEILKIDLASTVKKGSKIVLKIEFKGSHLNNAHGFFRSPFKGPNGEDKVRRVLPSPRFTY